MLGEERRKGKGWEGGQCEHVGRLSPCGSSGVPSGDAREGKLQHLPFSFPLCFPTCLFPHLPFSISVVIILVLNIFLFCMSYSNSVALFQAFIYTAATGQFSECKYALPSSCQRRLFRALKKQGVVDIS